LPQVLQTRGSQHQEGIHRYLLAVIVSLRAEKFLFFMSFHLICIRTQKLKNKSLMKFQVSGSKKSFLILQIPD
ncbi:MAG: hypothetical protein II061_06325, partial [Bacteroidaceae bacterium]|nr:hypothetical protein [Bacteroidaceae bacterium]